MHLSCNLYTVTIETCAEVSKVLTIHLQGAEADVSGEGGSGGEEERVRAKQPKKRSKSTASDKPSSTPKRLDLLSLKVCVVCHRECKGGTAVAGDYYMHPTPDLLLAQKCFIAAH